MQLAGVACCGCWLGFNHAGVVSTCGSRSVPARAASCPVQHCSLFRTPTASLRSASTHPCPLLPPSRHLEQLSTLSAQRAGLEEQLKELKNKDNILPQLMASASANIDALFAQELKKYDTIKADVAANVTEVCDRAAGAGLLTLPCAVVWHDSSGITSYTVCLCLPGMHHAGLRSCGMPAALLLRSNLRCAHTITHGHCLVLLPQNDKLLAALSRDNSVFRSIFEIGAWRQACEQAAAGMRGQVKLFREVMDHLSEGLRFYMSLQVGAAGDVGAAGVLCWCSLQRHDSVCCAGRMHAHAEVAFLLMMHGSWC